MIEFRPHPFADIFPVLEGRAFEELTEDVRANGLRESIVIYDGRILDGRNRYRACVEAGEELHFEDFDGTDEEALAYVVSLNLHRRHLSESQRGMVAGRVANMRQGQRSDLPSIGGKSTSQAEAAALLNVGTKSVERATKVLKHGTTELAHAVEHGKVSVSAAAEAADLPKQSQDRLVEAVTNAATPEAARKAARQILKEEKPVHVSHNSGENEWYTPATYIEAARAAMGGIDLDPASSEVANRTVGAEKFYTAEDDGLGKEWRGRVWMNPPYSQPLCSRFAEAVASKFEGDEIESACVLVNNATETAWFQRMLSVAIAVCFPKSRVKFLDPSGKPSGAPLQGQAILYFGANENRFRESFSGFGTVLVR